MAIVNDKRPVNLDLTTIKFPVPAIASIIHRISGVGLFVALPIVLWMLDRSLASPESFADLQDLLSEPWARFVVWGIVSMFIYHLVAGCKHLLMDLGIGETLQGGRNGAFIVLAVSAVLILMTAGVLISW
jgi:succinate dehydrogenase cytochrome b subunit